MSSRKLSRLFAALLGTLAALGIAWITKSVWHRPTPAEQRTQIEMLLSKRSAGLGTVVDERTAEAMRPRSPQLYIPREDALVLLPASARTQEYDPSSYFVHVPDLTIDTQWPEHPNGHWSFHTNQAGLREDGEIVPDPDLRILITGDSHIDGFCNNSESYPNLLESRIAALEPELSVDVLNLSDGGYSFHNYLGALEKFDQLGAALFVVNVYAGNDFVEVLTPTRYFARESAPSLTPMQRERRKAASDISFGAWVQGVASMSWFHDHPEDVERSLDVSVDLVQRMKAICDADKMAMLVVYIPPAIEIEATRLHARIEASTAAAGLGPRDFVEQSKMGDRFIERVSAAGVQCFDARSVLHAAKEAMFWAADFHMSVAGHCTMASALEPIVLDLIRPNLRAPSMPSRSGLPLSSDPLARRR